MTTTRDTSGRARRPEPTRPEPTRPEPKRPAPTGTETGRTSARAPRRPVEDDTRQAPKAVIAVRRIFAAETSEYFLLLGTVLFMIVFGLVMVLSSSSIESRVQDDDFLARFTRQGMFALIGLPVMLLLARIPASFWKRWAWHAVGIGLLLQLLIFVPGLGYGYGGNTNWLKIGPVTAQPSEFVKLALIVWLGVVLAKKSDRFHDWKHVALPVAPVAAIAIGFVLIGRDLGTAMIMVAIVLGSLFFAGVRLRIIGVAVAAIALVIPIFASLSSSRQGRIGAWLNGCTDPGEALTDCYQTLHGWWALADGGIFGVGLGNSTAKWSWLPEADNDFIFAIIGEELGLIGTILVLALFAILAICFVRIIRMQTRMFQKVTVSAVMIWVIGQAFVNIAVVLGLLPVLGVPLPLVSAGGSALITTMAAIGIVLSFARVRPQREAAIR